MRYLRSALRLVLLAMLLGGATLGSPQSAEASHFRYGNITWRSLGGRRVQFHVTAAFRRSRSNENPNTYPGSAPDGLVAVGDTFTEFIGPTTFSFGDNTRLTGPGGGALQFKAVAIDPVKDYVIGVALDPATGSDRITHTYATPVSPFGTPWVAEFDAGGFEACCRISTLNNDVPAYTDFGLGKDPSQEIFRVQTTVDLNANTSSAVSSLPPIIPVAQTGGSFTVPAVDTDPDTTLTFRLAQSASPTDPFIVGESGTIQAPGVTVDPQTGLFTIPAGLKLGLWSAQVIIEERAGGAGGTVVGQSAVDFIFSVIPQVTTQPPTFVAPTPPNGKVITGVVGRPLTFTVQATDPDGDVVTLNTTGAPLGAVQNPGLPLLNIPTQSTFAWIPKPADVGAYSVTYTAEDTHGNFVITNVLLVIQPKLAVVIPNGGETFLQNTPVTIRWTSSPGARPDGVKLLLSTDGGATFPTVITPNTPDTGTFVWTTPGIITRDARIRVVNVDDPDDADDSDTSFTISDGLLDEVCTTRTATPIPDFTPHPWTVLPLNYGLDKVVRGIQVKVDVTHPFIGDLQIFLTPPDFVGDPNNPTVDTLLNQQAVLLHNQSGGRTANLVTTYGLNPGFTAPVEDRATWVSKLYGRRSIGTWNLWIRDLKPGDVGQINQWCLDVIGPNTGNFAVTAPNGGEKWAIGTTQTITWTQSGIVGDVKILLSRDGGANFNELISTVPAANGTFDWTVTGPASQAKIRVQSVNDPVVFDDSNAPFTIQDPELRIIQPTTGGAVAVGKPWVILWSSVPMLDTETVKIELLHGDDPNFLQILTPSTPNTGVFTLPNVNAGMATDHAKLRITVNSAPTRTATTGEFAIQAPAITVTSPTASSVWYTFTTQNITWKTVGLGGNVKIEISRDGGATWDLLFGSVPNNGQQSWLVSGAASANAQIRVTALDNPSVFGVSPTFELRTMTVKVTSPNGGEVLGTGTTKAITWTTDGVTGNVDVLLSTDAGKTFTPLATNIANNGSFTWLVTGAADSTGVVRVQAHDFPAFDVSDAPFSIVGPSIKVIAPTAGQELRVGESANIQWIPTGLTGDVKIEISRNGGIFLPLFPDVANSGSQAWTVAAPDANAVIRVTSLSQPSVSGQSATFKIATPSLTVTAPNGGEELIQNTPATITWDAKGFDGPVRIELSRDGGLNWETIFASAQNSGSAEWQVAGAGTKKALVRVSSVNNSNVSDTSDAVFTITEQFLKLGSPNGGEFLAPGHQTVTWSSSGLDTSKQVKIELSRDGGHSWSVLASSVDNNGSALVDMPKPATQQARVRISLVSDPSIQDVSDGNFILNAPTLKVNAPGAGAKWTLNSQQTITWSGTVVSARNGSVMVELSRNNGATWETLFGTTLNDGSVQWIVSGKATKSAKIRVTWSEDHTVSDVSGKFSIVAKGKKK